MIIKWIWEVIAAFLAFILGLFPTFDLPSWWDSTVAYMGQGVGLINGVHNWLPLPAIRNCLVFLIAVSVAVLAVRTVRILASFATGGGGGAA